MKVLLANNTGIQAGYLAGKYEGQVGHLYSPGAQRGPYKWMPYALDNGKFPCWASGKRWDKDLFIDLLQWAKLSGQAPRWLLVPDEVGDAEKTWALWEEWADYLRSFGWPLAFAVQDGHTPKDVPLDADVVFVGGSDAWKPCAIKTFCQAFPRVHVGRINGLKGLRRCAAYGAESCDGTGWFRGDKNQLQGLEIFLHEQKHGSPQLHISHTFIPCGSRVVTTLRDTPPNRAGIVQG